MKCGSLLPALLCAAACARQSMPADASFMLSSSVIECRVGQPFTITVERTWARGQEPEAWDPAMLPALDLTWESRERVASGERMCERLIYRAYAFAPGEYSLAPDFTLQVSTGLPAADAGILEAPAALSGWSSWRWIGWPLGLAIGLTLRRVLRRRAHPSAPPAPAPSALQRLRELDPQAPHFPGAFNQVLRDWLDERTGGRAPGRLAEELLEAEPGLAPAGRDRLLDIVGLCQKSQFGEGFWPLEARRQAVAVAVAVVQEAS